MLEEMEDSAAKTEEIAKRQPRKGTAKSAGRKSAKPVTKRSQKKKP